MSVFEEYGAFNNPKPDHSTNTLTKFGENSSGNESMNMWRADNCQKK